MAADRLRSWVLTAVALAGAAGCAPVAPRDPATVIADAQCKAWARNTAQAEFARDARAFATAPQTVVPGVTSPALAGTTYGLAGLGGALTNIARDGRERELYSACMAQAPGLVPATSSRPRPSSPDTPLVLPKRGSCDEGMYWNSATQRCMKIGED